MSDGVKEVYKMEGERVRELQHAVAIGRSTIDPDTFAISTFNLQESKDCFAVIKRQDIVAIRDALTAELEREGHIH